MLSIPAGIVWQDVPGELVLFDQRANAYHCLGAVGSELWRRLAASQDLAAAIASLTEQYAAPRATIAADAGAFVADALAKGLLVEAADGA